LYLYCHSHDPNKYIRRKDLSSSSNKDPNKSIRRKALLSSGNKMTKTPLIELFFNINKIGV